MHGRIRKHILGGALGGMLAGISACLLTLSPAAAAFAAKAPAPATSLDIGQTFTLRSSQLGETRRLNVYLPEGYAEHPEARYPVMYLLDGGLHEDFLHVAGLLQVSVANGTMRPFILVGIENTQRRRDMTPVTEVAGDRTIAPVVGGAVPFRAFIRDELMPEIARRYRTNDETAIVGESAAGLFVMDTLVTEPALFDDYIAIDPMLWWNDKALMKGFRAFLKSHPDLKARLFVANSSEPTIAEVAVWVPVVLQEQAPKALTWRYLSLPEETHGSVFHPAAIRAFRGLLAPDATQAP